jgi:hypothetical protein
MTLFAAGSTTLTATSVTAPAGKVGTSAGFTVSVGSASKLGYTNVTNGSTTGSVSGCPFSCDYTSFGRSKTATMSVAVMDTWGNTKTNIGSSVTVTLSKNGGGSLSVASVVVPPSGLAQSPAFTYTSDNANSWSTETITATASGFTNLAMTINK